MTTANYSWVPHPGEYIKEELEARGWSQRDLSYILGCPEQSINIIIAGKRGISSEMAKALAEAFEVSAEFFANLQKSYDLSHARDPEPGVARRAKLQSVYPIREMIKRGWIENTDSDMLNAQIAKFFEVSSTEEIPYLAHAAKKTNYEIRNIDPTQLAWLFRVKQIARSISVPKYSEKALRDAIEKLHILLVDPEEIRHVPRILAECGIRYIIVEPLPQGKIDGVCLWIDKKSPVVGMSTRLDRIDNFWFVLRHELEHVLQNHGQDSAMIDVDVGGEQAKSTDTIPAEERIANIAAANFCVPINEIESFIARKSPYFSEKDILGFSRKIHIHPGLAIGQIQFRTGRYDLLKKHLVKIRKHILPNANVDGWGYSIPVSL
jgi:HTH-type transcriptional regulator/antitoxin HigA